MNPAAAIIGEVGDIRRFSNARKLGDDHEDHSSHRNSPYRVSESYATYIPNGICTLSLGKSIRLNAIGALAMASVGIALVNKRPAKPPR